MTTRSEKAHDVGPATCAEAFDRARHWGRYMRREGVVFKDRSGAWHCRRYCVESIKSAAGHFHIIGAGHGALVRWREAVVRLRNAERAEPRR